MSFSPLVAQPYRRPCIVVPNLDSFAYCNKPSGEHTALTFPICDECYGFIADAAVRPEYGPVAPPLGGLDVP